MDFATRSFLACVTNDVTYFIASFLQALNTALPLLLPKATEDVKMSIVVDSLPRISTSQKLDMLQETDEEVGLFPKIFLQRPLILLFLDPCSHRGVDATSWLQREEAGGEIDP